MQKDPLPNEKLITQAQVPALREEIRQQGKRLVLTNGCFDILHVGHINYLQQAKAMGDVLWVALNGDQSVKLLKGPARPILTEEERAYSLAALACVDAILIFQNKRLDAEIQLIAPDIYVKAGDYSIEKLDPSERSALQQNNTQISFLPFIQGYSTTNLIHKIATLHNTSTQA